MGRKQKLVEADGSSLLNELTSNRGKKMGPEYLKTPKGKMPKTMSDQLNGTKKQRMPK